MNIKEALPQLLGKRVAIDDAVTSYSSNIASHKTAWCHVIKAKLASLGIQAQVLGKRDSLAGFDTWLIALPMEFQGTFNLFGGADDDTALRIRRLLDFTGSIWVADQPMPDVGLMVGQRMRSGSPEWLKLDPNAISERCRGIQTLDLTLSAKTFVYGDSHAVSAYVPGADISRNDGQTLFGTLREGLAHRVPSGLEHLVTYFGNIDVRHHLCRRPDPVQSAKALAEDYVAQMAAIAIDRKSIVQLLPIEHEGRQIPKTGYYKGAPFSGSREERIAVMQAFNARLQELAPANGIELISWPEQWYTMAPEDYASRYMERPKSVHLSRQWYQYDFETGLPNPLLGTIPVKKTKSIALF